MFLPEWREFPSAPCLAEKKKLDSSRLNVVEIARVRHASELVSFLVGLRTYQHPGIICQSTSPSCSSYMKLKMGNTILQNTGNHTQNSTAHMT